MYTVKNQSIYFIAGFFSIFFSLLEIFRTIINPDGICYIQSAETMRQGFNVAMHLCGQANWPFYSFLIYCVSSITHLSALNSAYLINGFFSLLSVFAFIAIVQQLGGSARVMFFAAIVILFSHELNYLKQYIVRDHGFWAFYLISILYLLKFFETKSWQLAIAWNLSLMLAMLFRVEGILFLILLPWVSFLQKENSFIANIKLFIKLYSVQLFFCLIAAVLLFFLNPEQLQFGRLQEIHYQFVNGFAQIALKFQMNVAALKEHLLNRYSVHDAKLIFTLVIIIFYLTQIIGNLSLIYALLVFYAWKKICLKLTLKEKIIIGSYIVVNLFMTGFFLLENMFLASRYLVALSLILMLWIPFALERLSLEWKERKWLLTSILGLMFIWSGLTHGDTERYIRDAGKWIQKNASADAKIYSNNYIVMFYSQRFENQIFVKSKQFLQENALQPDVWKKYDYVILEFNKKKEDLQIKELGSPIKVFLNKDGDQVSIYKIM